MNAEILKLIWMAPAAYLLGSLPFAIWTGKVFFGIDIREHGSGNAGATNVMRVLGPRAGVPVLILDMMKGWAAVALSYFQSSFTGGEEGWMLLRIILGVLAVIGHIYPLFAGFRGGKGVATIAGVGLALHPPATLLALLVFILVLLLFKYVSLGSVAAGIAFPLFVLLYPGSPYLSMKIFSIIAALLLLYTHRSNLSRLWKGEEKKATFLFKKKD